MSTIITLTTDWGLRDYFVAALKGTILKSLPQVNLIDITHVLPRGDIAAAAYNLKNVWQQFPDGTIHFVGVDTEGDYVRHLLIFEYQSHYFIGFDSGIFSMFIESTPSALFQFTFGLDKRFNYLHVADIIKHIAAGQPLENIALPLDTWLERNFIVPSPEDDYILGQIIYIDAYGNLVTNIEASVFEFLRQNRDFAIQLRSRDNYIQKISAWYSDVAQGEIVAIFNEAGFIEIAINNASAEKLLGFKHSNNIRIEFYDSKNSKINH